MLPSLRKILRHRIDLHMHSTVSDGALDPREIVEIAEEKGMIFSITDHLRIDAYDNVDSPNIIPGIEVKASNGKDALVFADNPQELEEFYKQVIEPANPTKTILGATTLPWETLLAETRERGLPIIAAHPFSMEGIAVDNDAQEIAALKLNNMVLEMNGRVGRKVNSLTKRLARFLRLPLIAGSDAHLPGQYGKTFTNVRLPIGVAPTARNIFAAIRKRRKVSFRLEDAPWSDTLSTVVHIGQVMVQRWDGVQDFAKMLMQRAIRRGRLA